MTLNESIVEEAALECFAKLGSTIAHGQDFAPGEPSTERDSFSGIIPPLLPSPLPS